jgi:hypothetical protein
LTVLGDIAISINLLDFYYDFFQSGLEPTYLILAGNHSLKGKGMLSRLSIWEPLGFLFPR